MNPSTKTRAVVRLLPAEWSPQSGVMLTWPHGAGDWRALLGAVEPVFCAIAAAISRFEPVLIVCADGRHEHHIAAQLSKAGAQLSRVVYRHAASNDTWARDHGPITVLESGRPVLLDFEFNGWGNKYDAALDNQITQNLCLAGVFPGVSVRQIAFVLEGGSIDADGAGTLLTTTACLLTPTRNPDYTREGIEAMLRDTLGAQHVLWLEHGYLAGDDTDSHIDMLARFCDTRTIAHISCTDPDDEHFPALEKMAAELRMLRTLEGEPYRLVQLPIPAAKYDDGRRLPASHANFLVINGAVLVPLYDDPSDAIAMERLADCFPGREIIGIPCLPLIRQNGSLHCLTMQLPAGVLRDHA